MVGASLIARKCAKEPLGERKLPLVLIIKRRGTHDGYGGAFRPNQR